MRSTSAAVRVEQLSFADFIERVPFHKYAVKAFENHVAGLSGGFSYRTLDEWHRVRSDFLQMNRGRR